LRGREKALAGLGHQKLEDFLKFIQTPHVLEETARKTPWGIVILIKPTK